MLSPNIVHAKAHGFSQPIERNINNIIMNVRKPFINIIEQTTLMSKRGHPKFVEAHRGHIGYINGVLAWLGGPKSSKKKLGRKSILQVL